MIPDLFAVTTLGFLLGIRHATDADHVVAVTTIVARQRELRGAAMTGVLWGLGHSLTVLVVGSAIILFKLAIPYRVGIGMELLVGVMLIVLGAINVASFFRIRRRTAWGGRQRESGHTHTHTHGDYVHSHPPSHVSNVHPHRPDQTPLAAIDRHFGRSPIYLSVRPVVVGIVHGLAGSAAVSLLVAAAVRDPRWAIGYLVVFGVGTMAGMMLITMTVASAFRLASGQSKLASPRLGFACGIVSILFGFSFAYQILSGAMALPSGR